MDAFTADRVKFLKDYFQRREDVVFVFLFGSRLADAHRESDWDIGIYFKPLSVRLELESEEK